MTAQIDRAAVPPMTDAERKRILGDVYAIMLGLLEQDPQTADQQPPTEASYRNDDIRPARSA